MKIKLAHLTDWKIETQLIEASQNENTCTCTVTTEFCFEIFIFLADSILLHCILLLCYVLSLCMTLDVLTAKRIIFKKCIEIFEWASSPIRLYADMNAITVVYLH